MPSKALEFESIQKQIQEWTNNVPLIILGSGASIPFGLPSMSTLGNYLKSEIQLRDSDDQRQFEDFKSTLDRLHDLEQALQSIQIRDNVLLEIVRKTWQLVNLKDREAYEHILNPKTEFPLAELTGYLLYPSDRRLTILTTNYDRIAEYAASKSGAFICTGFAQNYYGQFSNQIHQNNIPAMKGFNGQVKIWKVHGSLDWFKSSDDLDFHFPLRDNIPNDYKPSIVTPGLTKYFQTHLEPFRTIFTQADFEVENANGFLAIGYGFNDVHIQPKLIKQIRQGKPVIVITKELTSKTKESIIGANCKNYILMEGANNKDTKIFSSMFSGELIVPNVGYWALPEFIKLVKS